jgi:hypothetical protein
LSNSLLRIVPVYLKEANAFVKKWHEHHGPVVGSIFQIGVAKGTDIVGVVICGRPVAGKVDNGYTLEVLRLCTDRSPEAKNACSMLYAASWRVAKNMGYKRIITCILKREPGVTLRAAGWRYSHDTDGRSWNVPSRPRTDKHELGQREVWITGHDFDNNEGNAPEFKKEKPNYVLNTLWPEPTLLNSEQNAQGDGK